MKIRCLEAFIGQINATFGEVVEIDEKNGLALCRAGIAELVEQPAAEEDSTEHPAAGFVTSFEPIVLQPASEESEAEQPEAEEVATEQPAAEGQNLEQPAAEKRGRRKQKGRPE